MHLASVQLPNASFVVRLLHIQMSVVTKLMNIINAHISHSTDICFMDFHSNDLMIICTGFLL